MEADSSSFKGFLGAVCVSPIRGSAQLVKVKRLLLLCLEAGSLIKLP